MKIFIDNILNTYPSRISISKKFVLRHLKLFFQRVRLRINNKKVNVNNMTGVDLVYSEGYNKGIEDAIEQLKDGN